MNTTSIIIAILFGIILVGSLFVCWVYLSLGKRINRRYTEFEKNRSEFSEVEIENLKADVCYVLSKLDFKIDNQEHFINNTHPESDYADGIEKAKQFLAENKSQRLRYKKMLEELDRELKRREHSRKYK